MQEEAMHYQRAFFQNGEQAIWNPSHNGKNQNQSDQKFHHEPSIEVYFPPCSMHFYFRNSNGSAIKTGGCGALGILVLYQTRHIENQIAWRVAYTLVPHASH